MKAKMFILNQFNTFIFCFLNEVWSKLLDKFPTIDLYIMLQLFFLYLRNIKISNMFQTLTSCLLCLISNRSAIKTLNINHI